MLLDEILKSVTGDDGYPGRHGDVRALARRRAGHARDPQRAVAEVLQLGGDRRAGPQAADPVDARDARHRHRRRLAVGDGDARAAGRDPGLARRGGLPAAADGGADPRRARALRRGGRPRRDRRCSTAPGTSRRSTRASAGARGSSASWSPWDELHRARGLVLTEHEFAVPLDHARPDGEQITVFAREVAEPEGRDKPFLVFLQGGPGFEAARPTGRPRGPGWLDRALQDYRVLMLDQRGTGRSTPVDATVTGADYLVHFRADCDRARRRARARGARRATAGACSGRASAGCACSRISRWRPRDCARRSRPAACRESGRRSTTSTARRTRGRWSATAATTSASRRIASACGRSSRGWTPRTCGCRTATG